MSRGGLYNANRIEQSVPTALRSNNPFMYDLFIFVSMLEIRQYLDMIVYVSVFSWNSISLETHFYTNFTLFWLSRLE